MIDLEASSIAQDPYPAYRALRAAGDVFYDRSRNICYVGDYQAAADVLRNNDISTSQGVGLEPTVSGGDGAPHNRVRSYLSPAFGAPRVTGIEERISSLASGLAERLRGRKRCDIVADYAMAIPETITAWMLGLDESRLPDIRRWNNAMLSVNRGGCPFSKLKRAIGRIAGRKPDPRNPGIAACRTVLESHLQQAGRKASGGWVTDLVAEKWKEGELSESETVDIGMLMVFAASQTPSSLIGSAVLILARDHGLQQRLRNDPQLLKPFIEEVLRFEAPVQRKCRRTTVPTEIAGVSIPEGTIVQCLIGSANRDPKMFSEPEQFRADRQKNRHLSFGLGPHFCLGAQLGRAQVFLALQALLQSIPSITLADASERTCYADNNLVRSLLRLSVSLG